MLFHRCISKNTYFLVFTNNHGIQGTATIYVIIRLCTNIVCIILCTRNMCSKNNNSKNIKIMKSVFSFLQPLKTCAHHYFTIIPCIRGIMILYYDYALILCVQDICSDTKNKVFSKNRGTELTGAFCVFCCFYDLNDITRPPFLTPEYKKHQNDDHAFHEWLWYPRSTQKQCIWWNTIKTHYSSDIPIIPVFTWCAHLPVYRRSPCFCHLEKQCVQKHQKSVRFCVSGKTCFLTCTVRFCVYFDVFTSTKNSTKSSCWAPILACAERRIHQRITWFCCFWKNVLLKTTTPKTQKQCLHQHLMCHISRIF